MEWVQREVCLCRGVLQKVSTPVLHRYSRRGGGGGGGHGPKCPWGMNKLRFHTTSGEKEDMSRNWGDTRSSSPGFSTKMRSFARAAGYRRGGVKRVQ